MPPGTVACGNRNDDSSSISSSGTGETKAFRVLSDLEFYNWDDAKDIVIGYENAEVSDVKIEGSSLSASDYTAENGKLTISRNKLDSYSEGKYELKVRPERLPIRWCCLSEIRFKTAVVTSAVRPLRGKTLLSILRRGRRSFSDMQRNRWFHPDSYAYDSEEYKLTVKSGFSTALMRNTKIYGNERKCVRFF